jgi:hypothetical protein
MTTEHDREAPPGRDWAQGPRIDQELWESFPNSIQVEHAFDPMDGLPKPRVPYSVKLAQAPPLLPETFVCMADTSRFVARDRFGFISRSFDPSEVERTPSGTYRARGGLLRRWIEVEPLRPQCQHYARQLTDVQDDPDFRFVARLCTLRKTDEGEYLSVRDSQVFACELREPRDYEGSVQQLDVFDAEQIAANRKKQKEEEPFDVEAALAQQDGHTE